MSTNSVSTVTSYSSLAVLLALLFFPTCHGARVLPHKPTSMEFIRASCSTTTYPALCFSSLSAYTSTIQTSPMQLANTALSVSLNSTRSASTAMKSMSAASGGMSRREASAMRDCMEIMGDSVDELRESLGMMGHLRGRNVGFQLKSIQTWVSAALTDDDTCMEGFSGGAMNGDVKNTVRSHVVNVSQLTSNALALVNGLTVPYQSTP